MLVMLFYDFIRLLNASENINSQAMSEYISGKSQTLKGRLVEFSSWQYACQARINEVRKNNGIR